MSLKQSQTSQPAVQGRAQPPAGTSGFSEVRRSLLCQGPSTLGASWARGCCETLRSEGRSIAGGWPGTLKEARGRVVRHFAQELSTRGMPQLSQLELEAATTATYERARCDWLESARAVKRLKRRASLGGRQ